MIWMLLACGDGLGTGPGSSSELLIADYDGLTDGSAWVYRDDMDTGDVDEERLLRTQYMGEGVVEFRRGTRWADAYTVGEIVWDLSEGLTLSSWSVFTVGSGDYLVSDFNPELGEVYSDGEWSCTVDRPAEGVSTWYGVFEDTFAFDCEGGQILAGRYVFARDVGLVRLTLPDGGGLNLVAPW